MAHGGQRHLLPVVVDGVSKAFRLPHERVHTLKERVLHPMRRTGYDRLEALRDVSFAVEPGEFFGVVGRNGSGKSTLLKCVAGIYRPDHGRIYVNGRLSTFIELGVGFNPDLAARDNVILNALMLGLSPREARERVERVIEFAELEEFAELKLKNYSSGMHVRLAFSVMIQVDADVLLVDEVLAVGDAAFQQKCFDEFHRLRDEGRTILFVTHDMGAVNRFCDRALLLERGDVVGLGDPREIAEQYLALNFANRGKGAVVAQEMPGSAAAEAVLREVWFEDEFGLAQEFVPQGRHCTLKARVRFQRDVSAAGFSLSMVNDSGQPVFATSLPEDARQDFRDGESAIFAVAFQNELEPGWRYYASLTLDQGPDGTVIQRGERVASMVVTGSRNLAEPVQLEHDITIEREITPVT
jgi:ABC-type polysaccharide/polyol phosphate transport system ATPase subunit